jgi:hypothetical protein
VPAVASPLEQKVDMLAGLMQQVIAGMSQQQQVNEPTPPPQPQPVPAAIGDPSQGQQ